MSVDDFASLITALRVVGALALVEAVDISNCPGLREGKTAVYSLVGEALEFLLPGGMMVRFIE